MTRLIVVLLMSVAVSPAFAQSNAGQSKSKPVRDVCAPIGRTADGRLVYGMACDNLPAPPPRAANQAAPVAPAVAADPEPEVERSGIFGMSYTRKPPSQ